MKLYTNGFWSGFIEKDNPVNIIFFIDLFQKVFDTEIFLTFDYSEADILLESIFRNKTFLYEKKWKYSFLFSGESRLIDNYKDYDCVLAGIRNNNNIVNVPLFVPYLYCSNFIDKLQNNDKEGNIFPIKNICAIISNQNGKERNKFIEKLEKYINIDHAGDYKNNIKKIVDVYNTENFFNFVKNYKFIITMENSREDTYITEKITHGFMANTIPIYWGSLNVDKYFNEERFINIRDINNCDNEINKIIDLISNENKYIEMINKPIFKNNHFERNINSISIDIKNILSENRINKISKIYVISSKVYEPFRYNRNKKMFKDLNVPKEQIKFICPTYKQTITYDDMNKYVKFNLIKKLRILPMKKSEISLFLNYKAVLEDIVLNYKDGIFLILESDAYLNDDFEIFKEFIIEMSKEVNNWDLIHVGFSDPNDCFTIPYINGITPYRNTTYNQNLPQKYVEDIIPKNNNFRIFRKFHTRCTDSFLWTFNGVVKFLDYMKSNEIYDAPFDYYIINFLENNLNFKHYWSLKSFFKQGTNCGYEKSSIQNDID